MSRNTLYKLVDIGANLGHPSFAKDLAEVIERAKNSGIIKMMITGVNKESVEEGAKICTDHQGFLYYTAGYHPHDAKEFDSGSLEFLERHLKKGNCVAVGECGLDFNRNFSPREQQLSVFESHVALACKLRKPLFVHEREAHEEMVQILSKFGTDLPLTVIHCFTGTAEEAKRYLDMGLFIGLTGFIWKDRSKNGVRYALKSGILPIERLLLETDAPFIYPKILDKKIPQEVRDSFSTHALDFNKFSSFDRNEPCSLSSICELVAGFSGLSAQEVARITTENALRIYGLND